MKKVFLSKVKVEKHLELVDNVRHKVEIENTNDIQIDPFEGWYDEEPSSTETENEMFNDNLYEEDYRGKSKVEIEVKNTDRFDQYIFDSDYMMTLKSARMSKEVKTPFAVIKTLDKKSKAEDIDTIYRMDKKIKYSEYKQGIRIGFVNAAEDYKDVHIDLDKTKKLVGIVNGDIPIRKKKGILRKKLGYIKLSEGTSTEDYYVEVTKQRNILGIILMILVIITLCTCISKIDLSDWEFDWSSLTVYKTQVEEMQESLDVNMVHRVESELNNGKIELGLTTQGNKELSYTVKIQCNEKIIYESEKLKVGTKVDIVKIQGLDKDEVDESGNYNCEIICDVYKGNDVFIGTLKSNLKIKI